MTKVYKDITKDISASLAKLRVESPEVMKGFSELASAASKDGALDKKTKELIALALGVAAHCDGCIGFHMQTLVRLGATKEEIVDWLKALKGWQTELAYRILTKEEITDADLSDIISMVKNNTAFTAKEFPNFVNTVLSTSQIRLKSIEVNTGNV